MKQIDSLPDITQVLSAPRPSSGQSLPRMVVSGPPCQVVSSGLSVLTKGPHWRTKLDAALLALPRTPGVFDSIDHDPKVSYNLSPVGSSAGQVILHCKHVIEKTIERCKPVTFKIGFSHNPVWRFNNNLYGYKSGKDRFEAMCVLYASPEPSTAAFLEAALIQLFQGDFPSN